jgi:hypothetical protein
VTRSPRAHARSRCARSVSGDEDLAAWLESELPDDAFDAEPVASRGHFYADDELADLARRAGLRDVAVLNESGGQLLTARS